MIQAVFVDGPWDGERRKLDIAHAPETFEAISTGNGETVEVDIYRLVCRTQRGTSIYAHRGRKGD